MDNFHTLKNTAHSAFSRSSQAFTARSPLPSDQQFSSSTWIQRSTTPVDQQLQTVQQFSSSHTDSAVDNAGRPTAPNSLTVRHLPHRSTDPDPILPQKTTKLRKIYYLSGPDTKLYVCNLQQLFTSGTHKSHLKMRPLNLNVTVMIYTHTHTLNILSKP